MAKYNKYKESGISWIGHIPMHWISYRFSTLCKVKTIKNCINEQLLSVYLDRGVIRFCDDDNRRTNPTSKDLTNYQLVEVGDFVLNNQQAWRGSVGVSLYRGIISPAYFIFSLSPILNTDFSNYLFRSSPYVAYYYTCSKGIGSIQRNLDWGQLKQKTIFVPPLLEQEKIVFYLDDKTSKIDAYITDKEKEVQLLEELKQTEIANVVTKGLNPNVKMKDSGISWIGEIPEHWGVKRIKSLFKENKDKSTTGSETLLSLSQYTGILPKSEVDKPTGMFEAESTVGYNIVKEGQFVMNIMLAWNGSYSVSEYDGIISPSYCVFDFQMPCNKKYYDYLLRTKAYSGAFKTMSKGIIDSRLRLYPIYFYTFKTLFPPISEQDEIVSYIESKTQKIDALIAELNSVISNMKEYKERLIADVVTGQINVK